MSNKRLQHLIIVITMSAVPLTIVLTMMTRGAILPHLRRVTGQPETWDIQYLLHCAVALVAAGLAVGGRRILGRTWCWVIVGWNTMWAVLALYATVSLWGDKV